MKTLFLSEILRKLRMTDLLKQPLYFSDMKSVRLTYKKFAPQDKDDCIYWYTDEQVMRYIKGRAMTLEEAESRFSEIIKVNQENELLGFYGVYNKFQFIGIAKLTHLSPSELEVGYGLLVPYWGKGYASEMIGAMIVASKAITNIDLLTGIVNKKNHTSIALLEKHGFKFISEKVENNTKQCYYSRKP